jgi:hypothetical protein
VFEGWKNQSLGRPSLILGYLSLVGETLADDEFRELVFWMVSSPWEEIGMSFIL